ncbi:hypothetical protein EW026_g3341 [Hermanssonia centrifuga]|uniref:Mitochondrial escape protein 2 n=1 Tax=Hermanssonia centrifuga TaxID=98765 RepID=A0A4V3XAP1_9APHY|nr:hypothetical protein EW026_g3341 [Hermanssonia centrifuga]
MNRYPSPIVKVAFDGPDVRDESLYNILRPYGRIIDLTTPSPVPAGTLRAAQVTFRQVRAAAIARNTIHGLAIPSDASPGSLTRLRTTYERPIQAHAIRDYISGHPKIFLPIFVFLLGSLTYTIFDPMREFMVEGKLNDWFDHRQYKVYKWLRSNMLDHFTTAPTTEEGFSAPILGAEWKERQDAEHALKSFLTDLPNTVTFLFGPKGSGKTHMMQRILKDGHRKVLIIDIGELSKASSDAALVAALANQTGYWPVFSFLNSMNNLIDLASVGLIGQKTGLSSSLSDQLQQVLDVVGMGLGSANTSYHKRRQRQMEEQRVAQLLATNEARIRQRIEKGIWHDPRLDCIAGNGIMSELGIGDEYFGDADADANEARTSEMKSGNPGVIDQSQEKGDWDTDQNGSNSNNQKKAAKTDDTLALEAMPVVVIKNFESKGGGQREELLNVLALWAANLAQSQTAHVIVISDNRENVKQLARALPSKPVNLISLSDADNDSALSLVKIKLHEAGVEVNLTREQITYIQRLGGRAEDLESLVHKVRSGMTVEQAVEDIIHRGEGELRKAAFGDDKKKEVSYYDVLMDFPFKGDEAPLRAMEHSELISINTHHGRPSVIKPGKPVYKYVYKRLVEDSIFQANQDIVFNQKVIAANESIVKACEEELIILKEVEAGTSHWWGSRRGVSSRGEYLLTKMRVAGDKIETLEKQNAHLKKILSKVDSS